jgi:Caspase domain
MKTLSIVLLYLTTICAQAQNVSSKSNEAMFDFSGSNENLNSSIPKIKWITPESEISFLKDGRISLSALIESKHELKTITLNVVEKETQESRGTTQVKLNENKLSGKLERTINLLDGINEIEIVAENVDGLKSSSKRTIHVGSTVLADASKLKRTDYALIFATDKYDNWTQLVNPIFDGRTISNELQTAYGFKTELIENPTQDQILIKLREYAERKFEPMDQLFIFIAGHGFYDDTFKEGFVVTKESLPSDPARTSYLPHSRIRSSINNNPCEHIFLVMDVCFGGTFDENAANRNIEDQVYGEPSQSEIITRKLQFKTRKYLTSGGKEYVSDGIAGKHSPFAKQFIEALLSRGGNDGILTLSELTTFVERLKTAPQSGRFGSDKQGSEFVFVVK